MGRTAVSARGGRRAPWARYVLLIYTAAVLAALLGTVNLIIFDHNLRWDLTPDKRYSLSEFDKRVLLSLTHAVRVMAFVRTEDPSYLELAELLLQVAEFTPRVTYQIIDVNKAPALARQYAVSSYDEVVVESQGRRRAFGNARPDMLVPAILRVSQAASKHIYFTVGHGEGDLSDSDRNLGYSEWRALLEENNYRVGNVSLFTGGVPNDASVVIALAPRKNFLPEELSALAGYLARGGHLIVFLGPHGSPSLVKFLKAYHMAFMEQVVVDPAYRLSAGEILTAQMPIFSKANPITRSMAGPAVFSMARGLGVTGRPGDPAPGGVVLKGAEPFLKSSDESWASGDSKAVTAGITAFKAGRDLKGPIPVGCEVDLAPGGNPAVPVQRMTRIIGFGSSAFASNQFLEMLGNRDLAMSAVNELAGDEMLIASRERLNRTATAAFYVTDEQARRALYLGALAEPALLFAIAMAVFARRRFFA